MAIGVAAGLIYFHQRSLLHPFSGTSPLLAFLTLSYLAISLITPYLWKDWLEKHDIEYFQVVVVVVLGYGAFHWFGRNPVKAILDAIICLVSLLPMLLQPLRRAKAHLKKRDQVVTAGSIQTAESKRGPDSQRRISAKYFGLLLLWLMAVELSSSHIGSPIPMWIKAIYVLPAAWLGSQSIFHLFKRETDSHDASTNSTN